MILQEIAITKLSHSLLIKTEKPKTKKLLSLFFSRSLDSVKKHVMEQSRDEDAMEVNEVEGESS